jgi:hypothetical protein
MKNIFKYCSGFIGLVSLIVFTNAAKAFPEECLELTAPATFVESTGTVCLQKIKVIGSSGTQFYKAPLQWLGPNNPNQFKLLTPERDNATEENSPSFLVDTGALIIPNIEIKKEFGIERFSANLFLPKEDNAFLFELGAVSVYINPDYIPNTTWKPYGMLNPVERHAVDALGRSFPYAKLADAVYDFDNTAIDTWKLIEQESKSSGMQAGVYSNQESGELVLAFRGTETCDFPCSFKELRELARDTAADLLLTFGDDSDQFRHAFKFAESVIARHPGRIIIVTGHSLGGGLAQAIGMALNLQTYAFNSAPVPEDFAKKYPTERTAEELRETIFVIADIHDPVSNTDETGKLYQNAAHVSPLIQFDFDEKEIVPESLKKLTNLRLNRHDITTLVENAQSLLTTYQEGW